MRKLIVKIPTGGQTVGFINIFNTNNPTQISPPSPMEYEDGIGIGGQSVVALLNYKTYKDKQLTIERTQGYGVVNGGLKVDIFKQEVDADGKPLTPLEVVGREIETYTFRDYNISNHRNYRYYVYFSEEGVNKISRLEFTASTNWQQWSVTELHPTDASMKNFTASADDVWLFNLNLESGAQTQNMARSETQTLGFYPKVSQGRSNYVSGQINCLLGSEVCPAVGYNEIRKYPKSITSNQRVDMLKAWRKLIQSKNPKLLKDREGQSFLVSLSESNNTPYDGVKWNPNKISFNWTQIGTLEGVTILGLDNRDFSFEGIYSNGCVCNLDTPSIVLDIQKIMSEAT